MPDVSRLSDAERRILLLLSSGHTAKSAAVALEISEGAVNERLRQARRKTGAASSRELARALAAARPASHDLRPQKTRPRETCDEKIGMAAGRLDAHAKKRIRSPWGASPLLAGAFMIVAVAVAASIGAFTAIAVADRRTEPPRVVALYPANGAQVPAGRLDLTVTFDKPMQAGWSFVMRDPATFPDCDAKPVQSKDRRSFTLTCTLHAGRRYELGFNNARHKNFTSESGVPAVPAVLTFTAR